MKNINAFFDKIYLISIDRNGERKKLFADAHPDLNYSLFCGVDGKGLNREELYEKNILDDRNFRRRLYPGEIGCALSHLNIYKDVVEKGYQRVLILEDDAVVVRENLTVFDLLCHQLPGNWELLYLGYGLKSNRKFRRNLRRCNVHERTHAYAITRSGAEKIQAFQTPIKMPADNALIAMYNKLQAFVSVPVIFDYRQELESTIWNFPQLDHKPK